MLALFILVSSAGAFWYFSTSQDSSSQNCQTPGTQEGWCLYENKEAGYSVEYPMGWYVNAGIITNFKLVDLNNATEEEAAWKDWYFKADIVNLGDFTGGSLKDWVKAYNDANWESIYGDQERPAENYSDLIFNGNPAVKHTLADGPWGNFYGYFISKKSKVFAVACYFTADNLKTSCDSIAFSFK